MTDNPVKSPFKFLDPFGKKDVDSFFGREKEVEMLYDYVNKNRIVLVYGQSGTGKTSIIQCGLANAFEQTDWLPVFVKRGEDLNTSLREALANEMAKLKQLVSDAEVRRFKDQLFEEEQEQETEHLYDVGAMMSGSIMLVTEDRQVLTQEDKKAFAKKLKDEQETVIANILLHIKRCTEIYLRPVYLILDQFEELLILGKREERDLFVQTLKYLVDQNTTVSCHVIIVMREEYFAWLDTFEQEIPEIADRRMRVETVRAPQAKKIIKDSCSRFNITLEHPDDNAGQIVKAFSKMGDISLPYLQVYLDQLWRTDYERTHPHGYQGPDKYPPIEFTTEEIREFGAIDDVLLRYARQCIENIQESLKIKFPAVLDENSNFLYDVFDVIVTKEKTKHPLPFEFVNGEYVFKADSKKFEQLDRNALVFALKTLASYRIVRDDGKTFELAHDSMGPIISDIKAGKRPTLAVPEITGNPYKGLSAYEANDYKTFFGRERVIVELLKKIEHNSLVVVSGPPGVGKTSLVKAGLIPRLEKMNYNVISINPEEVVVLTDKDGQLTVAKPIYLLESQISNTAHRKVVLYIDQFEQLSASCSNENKKIKFLEFINSLLTNVETGTNKDIRVIISVRSDYEFELDKFFRTRTDSKFNVPPFLDSELRDIISEPAYLAGLEFCPDYLVDTILRDVKRAKGSVPLLSHTLSEMYKLCNKCVDTGTKTNLLTEDMYNEVGGVVGSIPATANKVYGNYSDNDPHRNTVRNIMLRMVAVGVRIAGKRVAADDLRFSNEEENKRIQKVLNDFTGNHLLVVGKDDTNSVYYEPIHNSLVQKWEQVENWIVEDKAKSFFYYAPILKEAVKGKELGKLWDNDPRLQDLQKIAEGKDSWLNQVETEFVRDSVKKREEINRRKKHKEQEILQAEKDRLKLVEENALQQKQANRLLAEKLEEQQKRTLLLKRSRGGLVAGIVGLLAFGIFYFYAISAKEQTLLIASQALRRTNSKNGLLLDSNIRLVVRYKKQSEEVTKLLDENKVALAQTQRNKALISDYADKLFAQNHYKDSVILENEKFRERITLQKQPFYQSSLDSITKEQYLDTLIAAKFSNGNLNNFSAKTPDSFRYNNYKLGLNKLSEALQEARQNPNKALVLAKQAYELYPSRLIDSIGLSIANNNLFYKNKLELNSVFNSPTYVKALSLDQTCFAFVTERGLQTGMVTGDSIVLNKLMFIDNLVNQRKGFSATDLRQSPRILSLSFTSDNSLFATTEDGKIYNWTPGKEIPIIKNMPTKQRGDYGLTAISPNGKNLIQVYHDTLPGSYGGVNLEVVDVENTTSTLWRNVFNKEEGQLSSLTPSPDGKKVLAVLDSVSYWILNPEINKKRRLSSSKDILSASFTSDSRGLLLETKDSVHVIDLQRDKVMNGGIKKNTPYSSRIASRLCLSSDWKSLIVENDGGSRLYEGWNNKGEKDSLFYSGSIAGREVKSKILAGSITLGFVNTDAILSYAYVRQYSSGSDHKVSLSLLKNYSYFNSFTTAYRTINPYLTKEEKIAIGLERPTDRDFYSQALRYYDQINDYSLSKPTKRNMLSSAKGIVSGLFQRNPENDQYFSTLKNIDRALLFP